MNDYRTKRALIAWREEMFQELDNEEHTVLLGDVLDRVDLILEGTPEPQGEPSDAQGERRDAR